MKSRVIKENIIKTYKNGMQYFYANVVQIYFEAAQQTK